MGDMDSTRDKFYKNMLGDFLEQLRLPPHFMSNFRQQLSDSILLKCPSGRTWPVRLASSGNDWFFIAGWAKFAQDHGLKENDLLIFRYNSRSTFKVEIYSKTDCEGGVAHYVEAHASSCSKRCSEMQRDHVSDNLSLEESVGQRITRSKKLKSGRRAQSFKEPTTEEKELPHNSKKKNLQTWDESNVVEISDDSSGEEDSFERSMKTNESEMNNQRKGKGKIEEAQNENDRFRGSSIGDLYKKKYSLYLLSDRREFIPKLWGDVHLPNTNNLGVKLRGPPSEKLWPVLLITSRWKLAAGWYNFVVANNLEIDDVCIFELSQGGKGKEEPLIFDVFIHRVVEDAVPKTRHRNS
ncbi:hypothetical protein Tsubulata_028518 [Turnera subulata]|uniref:TF-B3 domain-containing protein n=1 Tax=Turnera subulata TaxID=218843 RepID=A0A9Q0IZ30_9ROSI|nr:hypothetical protein Tsubulata_028518 [Turnera subulata]